MGGLLKWTEGQLQTSLHHPPLASTATGCWGMGVGAFSGPTGNDSGYSGGPPARNTANLTALAKSRSPLRLTSITNRNQQTQLLWLVLLLAGVLQVTALSLPGLVKVLKTPLSTLAHNPSIQQQALLGLPSKNPKPDHVSCLLQGHTVLRRVLMLPCL